jgi:hypothetical protein
MNSKGEGGTLNLPQRLELGQGVKILVNEHE